MTIPLTPTPAATRKPVPVTDSVLERLARITSGSLTVPIGAAKIASSVSCDSCPLPTQPMSPPSAASALSELSACAR